MKKIVNFFTILFSVILCSALSHAQESPNVAFITSKSANNWQVIQASKWPKKTGNTLAKTPQKLAGTINRTITYMDVDASNGIGFDHPTEGAARREIFEEATDYVLTNLNHTGSVDIEVQISETDGTGALASGGTVFFVGDGFLPGLAYRHITSGVDPLAGVPDITVLVDFGHTFNVSLNPPSFGESDFYSVIVHEITHGLGFVSLIGANGQSAIGNGYSFFDRFLQVAPDADLLNSAGTFINNASNLISDNIVFNGSNAVTAFGSKPPIHSPNPFQSLAHWDKDKAEAMSFSPVMTQALTRGTQVRVFSPFELESLGDIGYSVGSNTTNSPPTIAPIADATVPEDSINAEISFSISDSDTPTNLLTVQANSGNQNLISNGSMQVIGDGSNRVLRFSTQPNQVGSVNITLTVSDGVGSDSQSFNITVTSVNDAPSISVISDLTLDQNTSSIPLSFTVDDEETPNSLVVSVTSSNQTLFTDNTQNLVLAGNGQFRSLTLTPNNGASGTAIITVTVSDGSLTNSTSFTVEVIVTDSPPIISSISNQSVDEDESILNLPFSVQDSDTDSSALLVSATSSQQSILPNNNIILGGSGNDRTLTLTPAENQNGQTTITITVQDDNNTVFTQFILTVEPVNDAPVANNDNASVNRGNSVSIRLLVNDTDPDGNSDLDPASVRIVDQPNGLVSVSNGIAIYTPRDGFSGTDLFRYVVSDNGGVESQPAEVTISVTNNNNPPSITGNPDTTVIAEQSYLFTPTATDIDGDTLQFSIANQPSWASFDSLTGVLSGTPTNDDVGTYPNIIITVSDASASAQLPAFSILVDVSNHPPVSVSDSYSITEGGLLTINVDTGVLTNDTDEDGDNLTVEIVSQPLNASQFQLNSDGSFSYQHNGEETFNDMFTYRANDGELFGEVTAVFIEIEEVNDPPTITSNAITVVTSGNNYSYDVAVQDPDDTAFTLSIISGPSFLNVSGTTLVGAVPPDAEGQYTVIISISDGKASSSQQFVLTVTEQPIIEDELELTINAKRLFVGDTASLSVSFSPGDVSQNTLELQFFGEPNVSTNDCTRINGHLYQCDGASNNNAYSFSIEATQVGDIAVIAKSAFASSTADVSVIEKTIEQGSAEAIVDGGVTLVLSTSSSDQFQLVTSSNGQSRLLTVSADSLLIENSVPIREGTLISNLDLDEDDNEDLVILEGNNTRIFFGANGQFTLTQTLNLVTGLQVFEQGAQRYLLAISNDSLFVYRLNQRQFVLDYQEQISVINAWVSPLSGGGTSAVDLIISENDDLSNTANLVVFLDFLQSSSKNADQPELSKSMLRRSAAMQASIDSQLSFADIDGDGQNEILALNLSDGTGKVVLQLSNAGSSFETLAGLGNGRAKQIITGDFNGNGLKDLVTLNENGVVQLFWQESALQFRLAQESFVAEQGLVLASDFNSDGVSDLVTYDAVNNKLTLYSFTRESIGAVADLSLAFANDITTRVDELETAILQITNAGPQTSLSLDIALEQDSGVSINSISTDHSCDISGLLAMCDELNDNETIELTISFSTSQVGARQISASVASQTTDLEPSNNNAQLNISIEENQTNTPSTDPVASNAAASESSGGSVHYMFLLMLVMMNVRSWCAKHRYLNSKTFQ